MDIFQYLFKHVENKNPKTIIGTTPLQFAAQNGHSDICKYISENMKGTSIEILAQAYLNTIVIP